ncbi:unnamed protein product [Bursaphelenchus okinawaensis]|uniref:Uncharacterized protein n=1 Tax=Bursaphelenchus okinawaensis TaxID=465554 RepID=A0A811LP02_9BILA|nr:unnamed protein product [Bursaphelenchus okinawaensis]CAG9125220.1 unnamed protein product [Bursaphelenchus okinawaensis]
MRFVVVVCLIVLNKVTSDRVPSADDVEDYNDPVLREVFGSRGNRPQQPTFYSPQQQARSVQQQRVVPSRTVPSQPQSQYQTQSEYQPNRYTEPEPYQPPSYPSQPSMSGYNSAQSQYYSSQSSSPITQLAVNGAQGFLTGAQAVGQAFGINPSYTSYNTGYELPIQGGFFG